MAKKRLYKIGDACRAVDIQPYVLRYWETEFPFLKEGKSRAGQRVYSEEELTRLRRIKVLLYEEGYTIAGAKKKLEAELEAGAEPSGEPAASPVSAAGEDPERTARIETLEAGIRHAAEQARALVRRLE